MAEGDALERDRARSHHAKNENGGRPILGIDGEGVGRRPHRYVYLCASDASGGRRYELEDRRGLSTFEIFSWLTHDVPSEVKLFGYSFRYDATKIVEDLPDEAIGLLFREDLRHYRSSEGRDNWRAIRWRGFRVNWFNGRLSVQRGKRRAVVWDIFKFYQSKFAKALEDWNVGTPAELVRIRTMKERRAEFENADPEEVKGYCRTECRLLAELGEKLLDAHRELADRLEQAKLGQKRLELRAYYGAGSTSGALLKAMGVREHIKKTPPENWLLRLAIACAYFGGRFELSRLGAVRKRVYCRDISSAYPYAMCQLPCLACAHWRTGKKKETLTARFALVEYTFRGDKRAAWAPFPHRDKLGSVSFPVNCRGWVWAREFRAGLRLAGALGVAVDIGRVLVLEPGCEHRPFAWIPECYRMRVALGKDGPGVVLKLGCNGGYGRIAQSKGGGGPFSSWTWAGMITSETRAMLLDAIAAAEDPWSVLSVATDGILSTEPLELAAPLDSGTAELAGPDGSIVRKPLGGWEDKDTYRNGVFLARPGIYGPLDPTSEQLDDCRARGIGRAAYFRNWKKILHAFERWDKKDPLYSVKITELERFAGSKTSLSYSPKRATWKRSPDYGTWVPSPIEVSFNPWPKREKVIRGNRLELCDAGGATSEPYRPALGLDAIVSPEAREMIDYQNMVLEQPDSDLSDVDDGG